MGITSPQKKEKRANLRLLFPIILSFLLIFLPSAIQLAVAYGGQDPIPTALSANVDLSQNEKLDFQNTVLVGEVEFYPNEWIVTEPSADSVPVSFRTPGIWVGYPDGKGGLMGRDGYGSYRYVLTGMQSGQRIAPVRNIDIPNRIFLNGQLCFRVGSPSKNPSTSVNALEDIERSYILVPDSGRVEVVVEVGNSGVGGADHLGLVVPYGVTEFAFASRVFAPFAAGAILAIIITTTVFVIFSPRRKSVFALVGILLSVSILYLFSRDSLLIGMHSIYGGTLFGILSLFGFTSGIVCLLLYGRFVRNPVCNRTELIVLFSILGISFAFVPFTMGTAYLAIPLLLITIVPLLMMIQALYFYQKGRGNLQFILMSATFVAYGLLSTLFVFDFLPLLEVYHPTIFAGAVALEIFASAFSDVLFYSIARRDNAILQHRYQGVTNRALAHMADDADIIASLRWLGDSYDQSLSLGDRHLINMSTLLRRRIMTLREESIPLATEMELESAITELRASIQNRPITLVLDVEKNAFSVPPLIFEGVIAEISDEIEENEYIVISDYRRAIRLTYPSRISLSENSKINLSERCSLLGQRASFRPGSIVIVMGGFPS